MKIVGAGSFCVEDSDDFFMGFLQLCFVVL